MKLWNALQFLALGFGPQMLTNIPDRTEMHLLSWARLLSTTAIDLRRPYLGYPRGPVGRQETCGADMRASPSPDQHSCQPSPAWHSQPTGSKQKKYFSQRPLRAGSCYGASLWPPSTGTSLGTVWPWAIPFPPIPDSSSKKQGRG